MLVMGILREDVNLPSMAIRNGGCRAGGKAEGEKCVSPSPAAGEGPVFKWLRVG